MGELALFCMAFFEKHIGDGNGSKGVFSVEEWWPGRKDDFCQTKWNGVTGCIRVEVRGRERKRGSRGSGQPASFVAL